MLRRGFTNCWQALALALGVVCTTAPSRPARAQESGVAEAKEKAKSTPGSAEAALAYGRALRRAGHDAEALVELRRAKAFARGEAATKVEWEIARTHIARREFQQAMATCRAMHAPGPSRVCAAEAHLLWRRGTEAMNELSELAKVKDASVDVQYFAKVAEGRARELETKDADAEAAYRKAIELGSDRADAHALLGALLHRIGKDGVTELRRAAEIDGKDPVVQLELGRALSSDPAKIGDAIAALERAVAERPTFTDALRALTEAYLAAKRVPDAKRTAESVLRVAPNDVFAHVASGRVALAEGRFDDALKEGETAFKLMPNEAKTKLLVADAYAKKGEIDLALEAYQAAHGLDHGDPTPLVNAARACLEAGRATSAKAFATRATKDFPAHAPAWIALGDALAADKDPAGAREAYENAKNARAH